MGRQLLPIPYSAPNSAVAGTIGRWVGIGMGRRRSFPIRVVAVGSWTGDDIIIEELVAGVPADLSLYGNNNLPIGAAVDTGYAKQLGTINAPVAGGQPVDLVTEYPTSEWIRARCGPAMVGNVTFCIVETLE